MIENIGKFGRGEKAEERQIRGNMRHALARAAPLRAPHTGAGLLTKAFVFR